MTKTDYSKNNHCKCRKLITNRSVQCRSCSTKERYKNNPEQNPMFGKHLSKKHKLKISKANLRLGLPKCQKCNKKITYNHKQCLKCYYKSQIGRVMSVKSRKRLSKSLKKYYKTHGGTFKGQKRPNHSKQMQGKNNPNYINGISKNGYPYKFNYIKDSIRKRDNYICQNCGKKQCILQGFYKKLDIHHIDYNKKNIKRNNLIALCKSCNIKANYNRDYWYAYFTYIIKNEKQS